MFLRLSGIVVVIAALSVSAHAQSAPSADRYLLQVGDEISIKVLNVPDLTETLTIAPDGRISALLVDEVQAAGLAVEELREKLTAQYARFYQRPQVGVTIKSFSNMKIYVGGEVERPGLIPLTGKVSALAAILQSGGFRTTAKTDEVILIRNDGKDQPIAMKINLKDVVRKGAADIQLQPFDVVYVPMSTIAKMDQFVDQYLRKMLPVTVNGGFNYVFGSSTSVLRFQ